MPCRHTITPCTCSFELIARSESPQLGHRTGILRIELIYIFFSYFGSCNRLLEPLADDLWECLNGRGMIFHRRRSISSGLNYKWLCCIILSFSLGQWKIYMAICKYFIWWINSTVKKLIAKVISSFSSCKLDNKAKFHYKDL